MKRIKFPLILLLIVLVFSLSACSINRRIAENYQSYELSDPGAVYVLGEGSVEYKGATQSDYVSVEIPSDATLVKEYNFPTFEPISKGEVVATIIRNDGSFSNITSPRLGFLVEDISQTSNFLILAYGTIPEDNVESRLRVKINVDQKVLLDIAVGQTVIISFDVTDEKAFGTIDSIGVSADENKTYPVYVEFNASVPAELIDSDNDNYQNSNEFLNKLKIGMSAIVKHISSTDIPDHAFDIPVNCIIYSPDKKTNVVKESYKESIYAEDILPTPAVTLSQAQYNQIKNYLIAVEIVEDAETGHVYVKSDELSSGMKIIYYEEN